MKIFTVHGTFANRNSDAGDAWWQLNSSFHKDVTERLGYQCVYIPFHWSGENLVDARREAGKQLLDFIQANLEPGENYILIGHSHGGSVIEYSLGMLEVYESWYASYGESGRRPRYEDGFQFDYEDINRKAVEFRNISQQLACWITVATPFIRYEGKRRSWVDDLLERLIFLPVLAFLLSFVFLAHVAVLVAVGVDTYIGAISLGSVSWFFLSAFFCIFMLTITTLAARTLDLDAKNIAHKGLSRFVERWRGFISEEDEAYWLINRTLAFDFDIPSTGGATYISWSIYTGLFVILSCAGTLAALDPALRPGFDIVAINERQGAETALWMDALLPYSLRLLGLAVFGVIGGALVLRLNQLVAAIDRSTARAAKAIVVSRLRNHILGAPTEFLENPRLETSPNAEIESIHMVSSEITREIKQFAATDAAERLLQLRLSKVESFQDVFSSVASVDFVHNLYFSSALFREMLLSEMASAVERMKRHPVA